MIKPFLALAFLLCSVSLKAQVRAVIEAPLAAPAPAVQVSPLGGLAPALTAPTLLNPLSVAPTPTLAAMAAPVMPQVVKLSEAVTVSAEKGQDPAPSLNGAYEASAPGTAKSEPVVAAVSAHEAVPLARPTHANIVENRDRGIRTVVHETVEVAAMALPFAVGAVILRNAMSNPYILIPSMLGLWALAAWAMRDHLRSLRSTVVGGWQASHDQRYRVDTNTGRLRDVRGHKYGEDRYDEYAQGPAGTGATALIGLAAALGAAAFLLL